MSENELGWWKLKQFGGDSVWSISIKFSIALDATILFFGGGNEMGNPNSGRARVQLRYGSHFFLDSRNDCSGKENEEICFGDASLLSLQASGGIKRRLPSVPIANVQRSGRIF